MKTTLSLLFSCWCISVFAHPMLTGLKHWHATFRQQTLDHGNTVYSHSSGEVWVAYPDYFLWKPIEPNQAIFLLHDQKLYTIDRSLEQVSIHSNLKDLMFPMRLLSGNLEDLAKQYILTSSEEGDYKLLCIRPKKNTKVTFKQVTVTFRKEQLYRLVIEQKEGLRSVMTFSHLGHHFSLPENIIPDNYSILNLGEMT